MKYLFILLIVFKVAMLNAQTLSPAFFVMDTTLNLAPTFDKIVTTQLAPGYQYVSNDKEGNEIKYNYSQGNDVLSFEYHYSMEKKGADTSTHPFVVYQSIRGPLETIVNIYNGVFNKTVAPIVENMPSLGGAISYRDKTYLCTVQADDFKPGYWVLSFLK